MVPKRPESGDNLSVSLGSPNGAECNSLGHRPRNSGLPLSLRKPQRGGIASMPPFQGFVLATALSPGALPLALVCRHRWGWKVARPRPPHTTGTAVAHYCRGTLFLPFEDYA